MMNISCAELLQILFDPVPTLWYHGALHTESCLNLAMFVLSIWALLRWTPHEMRVYRWYLLNVTLNIFLLDIWNTVFFAPVLYLDTSSMDGIKSQIVVATGLLAQMGTKGAVIGYLGFLQLVGNSCVALVYPFLYRFCTISQREWLRNKVVIFAMFLLQISFATPLSLSYLLLHPFNSPDLCCPAGCVRADRVASPWICAASYAFLSSPFVPILWLIRVTVRALRRMRNLQRAATDCTYKIQRQLVVSLVLQFSIPFILMAISHAAFATSIIRASRIVPNMSRLVFVVMSSHTSVNSAVMLLTIRPYRSIIWALICRIFRQKSQNKKPKTTITIHMGPPKIGPMDDN